MEVFVNFTDEQVADIKDQVPDCINSTCVEAVNTFGEHYQLIHAMEECGELIQAIGKYLRPDVRNTDVRNTDEIRDHIVEEVSDVRIMCDQIEYIFDSSNFGDMKRKKLEKLQKQIDDYRVNK